MNDLEDCVFAPIPEPINGAPIKQGRTSGRPILEVAGIWVHREDNVQVRLNVGNEPLVHFQFI